jgi:N,N-dimethylformamidase
MTLPAIAAACLSDYGPKAATSAYCLPQSAASGETLQFFVSSRVPYQIAIVSLERMVDGQLSGEELYTLASRPPIIQRTNARAWQIGCNWKSTDSFTVPAGLQSGLYAAECRGTDGSFLCHTTFVVRPSSPRAPILVLTNTNTWAAYNDWGRYSRYSLDQDISELSLERPNIYATPNGESSDTAHLTRAELWLMRWLRRESDFDLCSDADLDSGVVNPNDYRALVLNVHPEYWTLEMVARLKAYLRAGGRVVYLGGNAVFEVVRLDGNRRILFHDGEIVPHVRESSDRRFEDAASGRRPDVISRLPRFPYLFRNRGVDLVWQPFQHGEAPQPEREFLGVAFLHDNYAEPVGPMRVVNAAHWIFSGTQVRNGDEIGHNGFHGGACGREMDTCRSGTAGNGVIVDAKLVGGTDRGIPPSNLMVLAEGTNGTPTSPHTGKMTYYETPWNGFVFSCGSFSFTGALVFDEVLQQVVRNVVRRAIA